MSSPALTFAASLVALLSGCAGPTNAPVEPSKESTAGNGLLASSSAVVAPESVSCDVSSLAWNLRPGQPQVCAGPQQYKKFKGCGSTHYASKACPANVPPDTAACTGHAACGYTRATGQSHPEANTCRYADSYDTNAEWHHVPIPWTTKTICGSGGGDMTHMICKHPPCGCTTQSYPTTTCSAIANAALNYYHNDPAFIGGSDGTVHYGSWVVDNSNDATSADGHWCDYALWNVPNMKNQANDYWCGTHQVPDPDLLTYNDCIDPPYHSCGDDDTLLYSDFGKDATAVSSVADADAATDTCLTAEQLPLPTGAAGEDRNGLVQAKYVQLAANLKTAKAPGYAGTDNTRLATLLEQRMKLLFEAFGDALTPAQRSEVIAMYAADDVLPQATDSTGATRACGAAFTPPTKTGCTVDATTTTALDRALTMCLRLQSSHVHQPVRDMHEMVTACIDAASSLGPIRNAFIAGGNVDDGLRPTIGAVTGPYADARADADASDSGDAAPPPPPAVDSCAFVPYREAWNQAVTDPLATRAETVVDVRDAASVPEANERLGLMGRWYGQIESNLYPFAATSDGSDLRDPVVKARWRETSKITASFWRGVYHQLFAMGDPYKAAPGLDAGADALPDPNLAPTADQIEAAAKDTLIADRTILGLLYPNDGKTAPPIAGAPLLFITADALQAIGKRLEDVAVYHDMGCTYVGCGNGRNDSETAYQLRVLRSMANADELNKALTDARAANVPNQAPVVRPEWLNVFSAIAADHATFENAACDSANIPSASCAPPAGGADAARHYDGVRAAIETNATPPPIPATALASLVQGASARWASYATSGMLDPTARNKLSAGIQQQEVTSVLSDLKQNTDTLYAKTNDYKASMQTLAASLLQDIAQRKSVSDAAAQIQAKMLNLAHTADDGMGLQAKLAADDLAWGKAVDGFQYVQDVNGNALVDTQALGTFDMDATSARATGPLAQGASVEPLAVQKYSVSKGDILSIATTGQWSPTCALESSSPMSIPGNDKATIDYTSNALIGPEGWVIQSTANGLQSHANSSSSTDSINGGLNIDTSVCAGVRAEAGFSWPLIVNLSVKAYVDTSVCTKMFGGLSHTSSWGSSDTTTGSMGSSLSYSSGMRLDKTPFPDQPVGSVLAVITNPKHPEQILETRVLQRQASIIAPADADVYIVANDLGSCNPTHYDTKDKLTITINKLQTAASAAANVKDAVTSVLDTISAQEPAIVAQGKFLASQQASLRSAAISAISSSKGCNCNFSAYPDPVRNFFLAWIDHEIARIDMQVEIRNIGRQLDGFNNDMKALSDDLVYAGNAGQITAMLPGWSLRNLDMQLLRAYVRQVLKSATYDLYPILKLRFPAVFDGLATNDVLLPQMQTLVTAHWDDAVDGLAKAAYNASSALLQATSSLSAHSNDLNATEVALQFTRPGAPKYTKIPLADDMRSQTVWDQLVSDSHMVTFEVRPEDLYQAGGGPAVLECDQEAPVIRDLAIAITGMDSGQMGVYNVVPWHGDAHSAATMVFPVGQVFDTTLQTWQPGQLVPFELASDGWQTQSVQFLFRDDASGTFPEFEKVRPVSTDNATARGLSPFTRFNVDFSSFFNPRFVANGKPLIFDPTYATRAKQITLVMRVETRPIGPTHRAIDYLQSCPASH